MRSPRAPLLGLSLLVATSCSFDQAGVTNDTDVTSAAGIEMTIELESFVYVAAGASDATIQSHLQRQLKSSLGALREVGIATRDRDARSNLAPNTWIRTPFTVVGLDGTAEGTVDRVTYRYRDTALVAEDQVPRGPLELTLLFGDYAARRDELVPNCTDTSDAAADSIWYHYHPRRWGCRLAIDRERSAIARATQLLNDPNSEIAVADRDRLFINTRAVLTPVEGAGVRYPEYDRLWGFTGNTSRNKLVVYSFFGVDRDQADPSDNGLREYLRFQRTLRKRFPSISVSRTAPHAMLLDFWLDGALLPDITFDDVEAWIIDNDGFPDTATTSGKKDALRQQVIQRFSERWIDWRLPVTITDGQTTRTMTVEIRTFYGYEDGSPEVRQRAQWRYLEAFWHGDVFAYTGHSHFGHGPLAPWYYRGGNFPDRYQVMLFNSCLSFNYYDQDFIDIHPRASEKLDVVVNGLAAYWRGMGESSANFVASLIDGEGKSWHQLLESMQVDLPWERGYDPLRAVNGERDNVYSPVDRPLTVTN